MDDALIRFRQAADREIRRRPLRRRYSSALQHQAVEYCRQRRTEDGVRTIAADLGVSVTTLQRWTRTSTDGPRFRPIAVVEPGASPDARATVAVQMTASGPRVEGLTVETAARLLALLR